MLKSSTAIAVCCLVALPLGAAAQELPQKIKEAGKIVVANQPNYPPMEYRDPATNELMGVDIDLQTALAKELGLEVEWQEVGFEQMVSSLTTGRVDMIHSGMSDLPKRRDRLDFVDYMKSGAQFYTTVKNADTLKAPTDFCGKTVGMSRRTSFPDEAKKWSATNCEGAGKEPLKIVGTEGSADARTQLMQGRLDGAVQGSETLPYLIEQSPNTFATIGEPFTSVYQGMGFDKNATELRDAYVAALEDLMKSGEYAKIFEKWGLSNAELDTVMVNNEPVK